MAQKRIEVAAVGIWSALRSSILPLAKKHPVEAAKLVKAAGPRESQITSFVPERSVRFEPVPESGVLNHLLELLTYLAVEPDGQIARRCIPPAFLLGCYTHAPELTLAVLRKARAVWFKPSKAQRIWRLLASSPGFQPLPHQPAKTVWYLTDKELMTAMERLPDMEGTTESDVEKARKKLTRDIEAGKRLLANW